MRNHRQRAAAETVAALAQRTHRALFGPDQPAVIVAHRHAQTPLAEIMIGRIGRLEIGQLQDAFIHRRHADIGRLVGQARKLDRHGDRLARANLVRHAQRNTQGAGSIVHPDPGDADGAYRLAPADLRQRPVIGHQHIGARAPVGGNRNIHRGAAGRSIDDP